MTAVRLCNNTLTCNCPNCTTVQIDFKTTPPAPRLVGIETNPGPRQGILQGPQIKAIVKDVALSAATQAAANLGKAVAGKTKAKKKTAKKSAVRSSASNSHARSSLTRLGIRANAPVSMGRITQNSMPHTNIRVPFCTTSYSIYTTTGTNGDLKFGLSTGSALTVGQLVPNYQRINVVGSPPDITVDYALGTSIRDLASLFKEYRISSLKASFIPFFPTTQAGVVTLAFATDPNTRAAGNIDRASAYTESFTTPIWQTATIDLRGMVGNNATQEKYYMPSNVADPIAGYRDAEGRLTSQGAIIGYASGLFGIAGVTQIGYIRFEGEIDFYELCPFQDQNLSLGTHESKTPELPPLLNRMDGIYPPPPLPQQFQSPQTSSVNSMTPASGLVTPNPNGLLSFQTNR